MASKTKLTQLLEIAIYVERLLDGDVTSCHILEYRISVGLREPSTPERRTDEGSICCRGMVFNDFRWLPSTQREESLNESNRSDQEAFGPLRSSRFIHLRIYHASTICTYALVFSGAHRHAWWYSPFYH